MTEDKLIDRRKRPIFIHSKLDELPLSMEAFRVYCHLARRADVDGKSFPSYRKIGENCFRGSYPDSKSDSLRRKAIAAVAELIQWNLVEKQSRKTNGVASSNLFILTDESEWNLSVNTPSENARKSRQFKNRKTQGGDGGSPGVVMGVHQGGDGGSPISRSIEVNPIEVNPLTPISPQGEESANVEEEEGSALTAREEEAESESSDRPSLEKELTPVQPTQVSGKDKSSAPAVATKKQKTCLQDCCSGADVLEQLSNDPGILDCDPVPRTVLQEMQLRNWVWPWRRDRKNIIPEFLRHRANQMPTSKNDQADMSPLDKARRNILNSERTVGGLILLATEFEAFKSGATTVTKRVNGHEPIRVDFQERFAQAQRLQMVEGDWFRDEIGQIRIRLFGGELVSQAKFMTLPLEKPKDLQTPEEARSLLDQIRQYKAQAAEKLHNSRAKQTKAPTANVVVASRPLVDNVVGLCDRRAEVALVQKLREISEELADPTLLKDPLTQARAESFVAANANRFRAVRGKDNLILAIEEPTF